MLRFCRQFVLKDTWSTSIKKPSYTHKLDSGTNRRPLLRDVANVDHPTDQLIYTCLTLTPAIVHALNHIIIQVAQLRAEVTLCLEQVSAADDKLRREAMAVKDEVITCCCRHLYNSLCVRVCVYVFGYVCWETKVCVFDGHMRRRSNNGCC